MGFNAFGRLLEMRPDLCGRVRFLALMIPHHRGGVDMAKAALDRAKDPEVRRLADLIAKAQASEIAEMEATRRRLGFAPVPAGTAHH